MLVRTASALIISSALTFTLGCAQGSQSQGSKPTPVAATPDSSQTALSGPPPHVFVYMLEDPSADPRYGWPTDIVNPLAGAFYDCAISAYVAPKAEDTVEELGTKDCIETFSESLKIVSAKKTYPQLNIAEVMKARYGPNASPDALAQALRRDPGLAANEQAQSKVVQTLRLPPTYLQSRMISPR